MKKTHEISLDLFDLLSAEHQVLAELMGRITDLLDKTCYVEVADHFAVFAMAFDLHAEAEEEAVYAVLREGPPALEALIEDAGHHHALMTTHVDQLVRMDVSRPEWRTRFAALVELIQCHVDMEEGAIRDMAADELTSDLSSELARDYLETKRRLANGIDGVVVTGHEGMSPDGARRHA
ncbi:MAG TPA: hemerythrin domain-containing protein [Kofleriaceae bacterium]|nr:hemerythrin domain-containing protein [Kofleriaceae bacterium]